MQYGILLSLASRRQLSATLSRILYHNSCYSALETRRDYSSFVKVCCNLREIYLFLRMKLFRTRFVEVTIEGLPISDVCNNHDVDFLIKFCFNSSLSLSHTECIISCLIYSYLMCTVASVTLNDSLNILSGSFLLYLKSQHWFKTFFLLQILNRSSLSSIWSEFLLHSCSLVCLFRMGSLVVITLISVNIYVVVE